MTSLKTRCAKLEAELKWAWDNLRYVIPYPDDEAEYDQCAVCGNPDFAHKPNCAALEHEKSAIALLIGG